MGRKEHGLTEGERIMLGPSTPDHKLDALLAQHREKLDAMSEALRDELAAVEQFEDVVGDIRKFRFLRGFKFDAEAATEAMREMLVWRKENNIDEIRASVDRFAHWTEFPGWDEIGRYFPANFDFSADKDGRPLWISELGLVRITALVSNVGIEKFMIFHFHMMEWKTKQLHELSKELNFLVRMIVIRDLTGVGMHMLTSRARALFMRIVQDTQNFYPESMERNFFVNVPWVGHACWRVVRPMVAERTLHKIVFVGGDPREELLAQVPAERLPARYGGANEAPLYPLYSGESERLTSLAVGRGAATFVHVPLAEGDVASWEVNCKTNDIAHSAVFTASAVLGTPASRGVAAASGSAGGEASPASPASTPRSSDVVRGLTIDSSARVGLAGAARVCPPERLVSTEHTFHAPAAGTLVIKLDNHFSWVMGKQVDFGIDVVPQAVATLGGTPEEGAES